MRAALFLLLGLVLTVPVHAQDAQALRARHAALQEALADNHFGRPIYIESAERGYAHQGTVLAVIEQPFRRVATALRDAAHWCDVLILQANVKHCEASGGAAQTLAIFVAREPTDSPEDAFRSEFRYQVSAARADYLRVALDAPKGPLGMSDYRIRLEAAPLDGERTILHFGYAYTLGWAARMAMDMYLAFSGRDKVGFSVVERTPEGRPVYVGGARGIVERNTMRNYLALEAFLGTLDAPLAERIERRLRAFHAALERHPRQLREHALDEYLAIKRPDVARLGQQARR